MTDQTKSELVAGLAVALYWLDTLVAHSNIDTEETVADFSILNETTGEKTPIKSISMAESLRKLHELRDKASQEK